MLSGYFLTADTIFVISKHTHSKNLPSLERKIFINRRLTPLNIDF